ncbi:hypothetical protein E6C64_03105 [Naasia lichenicola]|uniref:Uncharacterized protein n=1 Tax=Naasia lichenicola TaxID=2565933 RepID=A0A4S4FTF0_9MICO|nr:hypothetical protein E6C64_03105 [Naasia lichenicola]
MHTTNYDATFIEVADDCPVPEATVPVDRGSAPSIATMQFEMIAAHPYAFTSDEVIFEVFAERAGIPADQRPAAREEYFSVGRACLRASPLGKRWGWGVHSDGDGRVAVVPLGSPEYDRLRESADVAHLKAMRSSRS